MKNWIKKSALGLTVAIILCLAARAQLNNLIQGTLAPAPDSIVQITADAMGLEPVAYADLPRGGGTFWWVEASGVMAPLPCPPMDRVVPIYAIAEGHFLVDDTGGQVALNTRTINRMQATTTSQTVSAVDRLGNAVADLIEQIQQTQFERTMMMSLGVPMPGDGGGGGGGTNSGDNGYFSTYTIDTNLMWLEITNVSNGWSHLNLHSGTNPFTTSQVFAIWTKTNLLDATWNTEKIVSPTADQTDVMPFSLQNFDRPILFFKVQDWTGVTENGNTVPNWWLWQYFGTTALSDTNIDSQGNTLVYDYTNHLTPYIAGNVRLGYWNFDITNTLAGDSGQMPLLATNVTRVSSWDTNAVLINCTNAAILKYRDLETNGTANILLPSGSIRFWFKPDWNSGTGPGSAGRLIEVGNQTATNGWWALALNTNGTQLTFGTQAGGLAMTNLTTPIYWDSNQWHQVVLTYTGTNSSLYLDGEPATNGAGSVFYPNAAERVDGFRIGSDANGGNQAAGTFDELETFSYPLDAASIQTNYQWAANLDSDGDGISNILENQLGLDPYASNSIHGLSPNNGLQVFTPLK